jgi:hypothetical protein
MYIPILFIIFIVVSGALIFSAMYFNHKEKLNLISQCHDIQRSSKHDSKNKTDLRVIPKPVETQQNNSNKFRK